MEVFDGGHPQIYGGILQQPMFDDWRVPLGILEIGTFGTFRAGRGVDLCGIHRCGVERR